MPNDGVTVENISDRLNGFRSRAKGPRSVAALHTQRYQRTMAFMDVRRMTVAWPDCTVQRVVNTGDLGVMRSIAIRWRIRVRFGRF